MSTAPVLRRVSFWMLACSLLAAPPAWSQGASEVGAPSSKPELTKAPKLYEFVEAVYPESEKALGRAASVVLQLGISARGAVEDARVLESGGPAFDAAALEAVRRFRFEPAEVDGAPAPIRIQYRYDFVLREAAPSEAEFAGVVRVRGSNQPLAGVRVELADGSYATTDAAGRFVFPKLGPGVQRVLLSRSDLKAMQTEEKLEAGQKLEAVYEVEMQTASPEEAEETDDLEIVVVAPKLTKQVVSTKVEASEAKRVAGTQGDVLKIVENLPGVARASAGSGQVVVWGAAPQDTRVYVDGVRVPLLYHFGGLRSVVHTDLVGAVELIPGGYGAGYGRGLGGLITVETREPAQDRVHGSLQLDVLDASAAVQAPVSKQVSLSAAARRSHLDWTLERVTSKDVGEFFPIPRYYDAEARLRYQPSPTSWVEIGGLLSSDEIERTVSSNDPTQRKREGRSLDFERLLVRYHHDGADGARIGFLPWLGRDHQRSSANFGGVPTELEVRTLHYGLRTSYQGPVAPNLTGSVGLDLELSSASARRSGSISSPAREGDARVFGQPPADQINVDAWESVVGSAAPYVEGDLALFGERLHVAPGLRLEPFFTSVNRRSPAEGANPNVGAYNSELSLQPRLSLRYSPTRRVTFKGAYGRYRQAPQLEDLSAVFGNPLLETSQATHWVLSAQVNLSERLTLETTAFYAISSGLAVRNPITAPLVGEALVGIGKGRSFGAQFLIRRELSDNLFGWIAYTLLRSERLDRPDADYRLFDFDQTHVLTALASYDLGKGFDVGARIRYATGYPRTPVVGAFYDARRDRFEPVLGPRNSERLPGFFQVDARASKRFKIGQSELELYADVQNVSDRENAEEVVYSADYREKRFIRGLPVLPVLGARWSY